MAISADQLPDDPNALKAMVLAREAENAGLRQIIRELQRHRFGRRAETLPEGISSCSAWEAEQVEAAGEEQMEQAAPPEGRARTAKRRANRGALPAHLVRVEMVVDIEERACPCCRSDLHRIGEDVSERLDIVPAQLRVIVVRRPKYACRACEDIVVQSPAPARLAEAIRYTLSRWEGLTRVVDDGRIEIDATSSSARSAESPSIARTRSSPAPTAAPSTGPSSPP